MKYFKILMVMTSLAMGHTCFCQLAATLNVNQPPATISEWYASNTAIVYVTENIGAASRKAVIKTSLKTTDGTVVATTNLALAPVYTLQGTRIFFAREVFPMEIMVFNSSFKAGLEKTGQLPAGTYQLEVQLVEPGTFMPLSNLQVRVFNLAAAQLPYLVMPVNQDTLDARLAQTAIIFRWTPLTPRPVDLPYYRIQVFEVYAYQQPLQALRGNQPILDQVLRGQTQYIWRPQLSFNADSSATRFIWTIQTLNSNRLPFNQTSGNGESRSEPFMFYVKPAVN